MKLKDLLALAGVEITAKVIFTAKAKVPLIGEKELVDIKLSGFEDRDDDGNPEFYADVELLEQDVIPVKAQKVELPLDEVLKALTDADGNGTIDLLEKIDDVLEKAGVDIIPG